MSFHDNWTLDLETGFLKPVDESKMKMGQLFTPAKKLEWIAAYAKHANFNKACDEIGFLSTVVRDHINGDDKFNELYRKQQGIFNDNVEECLYLAATKSKNVTAMFGWLRANYPKKYRENYQEKGPAKNERLKQILENVRQEENKGKKKK